MVASYGRNPHPRGVPALLAALALLPAGSARREVSDSELESRRSARADKSTAPCWDPKLDKPKIPWGVKSFCARWPLYDAGTADLKWSDTQAIKQAVKRALAPFATERLRREMLIRALKPHCMSRLCMHIQIIGGKLYVVAPHSKKCKHADGADSPCNATVRQLTPGLRPEGWSEHFNPTQLEWHFYAGLNMSDCSALVRPGDWNGAYTRLRMQSALRLLEEAARNGNVGDMELVYCANECPVNAGGWCLSGEQPVFASTSNEEHALIAFPHWMPNLRDWGFWVWDEVGRESAKLSAPNPALDPVAVFRGGLYRLNVYSDEWRTRGVQRTELTPENWRSLGRTALLDAKQQPEVANLINVNFKASEYAGWTQPLGVRKAELQRLDQPDIMPLSEQQRQFRYTINAEGHGGWADRLYRLLMSPQLVIAQDLPFRLWYEYFLEAGKTHLVVDSNFRNLSRAIEWARQHSSEVDEMVARANAATRMSTSVAGIRAYVRELLLEYGKLFSTPPTLHPRAVQFACGDTRECRQCVTPTAAGESRRVCGTKCKFFLGDSQFDTLHSASHFAGFKPKPTMSSAT